jgi:hypothetical protein
LAHQARALLRLILTIWLSLAVVAVDLMAVVVGLVGT